jgi:uncharacterized membrane protein
MISQEDLDKSSSIKPEERIGRIPPAALLAEYERVLPGVSERLIRILEQEQMHRHQLEINAFAEAKSTVRAEQFLLLIVAICSVLAGVFLSFRGAELSGTIMGAAGIIAPLVAFLKHRWA